MPYGVLRVLFFVTFPLCAMTSSVLYVMEDVLLSVLRATARRLAGRERCLGRAGLGRWVIRLIPGPDSLWTNVL